MTEKGEYLQRFDLQALLLQNANSSSENYLPYIAQTYMDKAFVDAHYY